MAATYSELMRGDIRFIIRLLALRMLDLDDGAQNEALLGQDRVRAVRFKDGTEIPADLVVMAVGIRPNIELAKAAGLHCERGIVVNDTMQNYDPRIYAVGECVQHRGQLFGLVAPLFEQAKVCADYLVEFGIARYQGSVTSTKLKVNGIDLFSAGDFQGAKATRNCATRIRRAAFTRS